MTHLLILLHLLATPAPHPLKMCVCDAKYRAETGQFTLKFKFFWDDLEATLEKQTGKELDLRTLSAANAQLLDAFLQQQFALQINGEPMQLKYARAELQDVVLQVEWVAVNFKPATNYHIALKNQILLDVFPDQYNIVRFDFFNDGNLETMRFERQERFLEKRILGRRG